jgi:hypothetical protein
MKAIISRPIATKITLTRNGQTTATVSRTVNRSTVAASGIQGPKGDDGEQGPQGDPGPPGDGSIDRVVTVTFDGQGNTVAVDSTAYGVLPFAGTFTGWRLASNVSGSIVIDLWKTTFGETTPTVANTITPTGKPTLTNEKTATGTFSAAITANDLLACHVDSVSGLTKVVLELIYEGA